ncbi:hypothetical protein ABZ471_13930 [Streptomyces sp. NPDC005728]|uniref:hypothetical protein n=1 Tax=Streptomyces sp. NPDC005728 TaxID=3157054 RepID=UPI0033C432A2
MGREDHVCPVCGQPVDKVVGRHKTLGTWVPVWSPGPCRNPGCSAYGAHAEPAAPATGAAAPLPEEPAAQRPAQSPGESAAKDS